LTYQIFLSGHVKKNKLTTSTAADAQLVCHVATIYDVKGLALFSDGTFIAAIEGGERKILDVFEVIKNHHTFSQTEIMMKLTPSEAEFEDFKVGFLGYDFSSTVPQSFRLTSESLTAAVPKNISAELKILFQTFARVNNLRIRQTAA